jgi:formylglycine-generating enzyme required for sulfatase activity
MARSRSFKASSWSRLVDQRDVLVPLPGVQGLSMRFRPIPAGEFVMGSRGQLMPEEPRHRVVIPHDFLLGKYVVTQIEWRSLVEAIQPEGLKPSPSVFCGDGHPVENVSWDDVTAWCQTWTAWLEREGTSRSLGIMSLRLPAEAEWEYACRAGSDTQYWNGDGERALRKVDWFDGNAGDTTHDVTEDVVHGSPENHPAGLVGMHGNVCEWCADIFDDFAYRKREDGSQAKASMESWATPDERHRYRTYRGGAWLQSAGRCRSACRYGVSPGDRFNGRGFRVCLFRGSVADKQTTSGEADIRTSATGDVLGDRQDLG